MARVTVRMWTRDGYHKDVAVLDEQQVWMIHQGMEAKSGHIVAPVDAVRITVDPSQFPEAVEFDVIVEKK